MRVSITSFIRKLRELPKLPRLTNKNLSFMDKTMSPH